MLQKEILDVIIEKNDDEIQLQIENNLSLIEGLNGQYLLLSACIKGRLKLIRFLADQGVSFNSITENNNNIFHFVCENTQPTHIDIFIFLIKKCPELIYSANRERITPIQLAVRNGFSKDIFIPLIREIIENENYILLEIAGYILQSANENNSIDKFIILLIQEYIQTEHSYILECIRKLSPSMNSWRHEQFLNYLGTDLDEYSDDSDTEVVLSSDIKSYLKDDLVVSKEILERNDLHKKIKECINGIKMADTYLNAKIDILTKAENRRSNFKINTVNDDVLSEIELINETIRNTKVGSKINIKHDEVELSHNDSKVKLKHTYYIPCFRGISYLVDRWSVNGRRGHRRLVKGKDFVNYAEANVLQDPEFYKHGDYERIDPEKIRENARTLKTELTKIKSSQPMILSKKEGKRIGLLAKSTELKGFNNGLDALNYMFSNGIDNFLTYIETFNNKYPGIFPNNRNPFLPFSHLPFHALKYAFGEKNPYSSFALPPLWDNVGRPRKPHVGKLTISIHPLKDFLGFDQPNVLPYLAKNAGVSLNRTIGPEYEVSFLSYIPEDRIFKQKNIRYPSFHHKKCPEAFLVKYGLNEELYQDFKKYIIDPFTRKNATEVLKNWLWIFHSIKVIDEVYNEIKSRGGEMLFYHPDGSFNIHYPSEANQFNSIISEQYKKMAHEEISESKLIFHDNRAYRDDIRGLYATGLEASPRTPPSGHKKKGEIFTPSPSPKPYLPILKTDDMEGNISQALSSLFLNEDEVKKESLLLAENSGEIGPREMDGFILQDNAGIGNCFYEAIADQMQLIHHDFIEDVPNGTLAHDSLRLAIQGLQFRDEEWADDRKFDELAKQFPNVILAVIDTRTPETGFVCYYINGDGEVITNTGELPLPNNRQILRIAATGNHFLSVKSHFALVGGCLHDLFAPVLEAVGEKEEEKEANDSSVNAMETLRIGLDQPTSVLSYPSAMFSAAALKITDPGSLAESPVFNGLSTDPGPNKNEEKATSSKPL